MTDEELRKLARKKPEELGQMIASEIERQSDRPMSKDELWESQKWVNRAESALKEVGRARD